MKQLFVGFAIGNLPGTLIAIAKDARASEGPIGDRFRMLIDTALGARGIWEWLERL